MRRKLAALLLVAVLALVLFLGYKIVRWRAYVWLPDYVAGVVAREDAPRDSTVHVIFVFVDHYEPGRGDAGAEWNRRWLEGYKTLAAGHRDSYGRMPQHTWFYAYDHKNEEVMKDLSQAVGEGYGEIEFHWHHGGDTNESFPPKLEEALRWFNSFGAMVSVGPEERVRFGFVHGNCALDNSTIPEHCGVTRELDALRRAGCYADFTFPSLGSPGREDSWVGAGVCVKGRPEWKFVKVYTHGAQSMKTCLGPEIDARFGRLEERYGRGRYRLHYVTAREAYNMVRAAEDGLRGDPDIYRDYEVTPPRNRQP